MMTYELCLKLIGNPYYTKEELQGKYDVLFLMKRLEEDQYKYLTSKLSPSDEIAIQEQQ